jgi:hypothetical protein
MESWNFDTNGEISGRQSNALWMAENLKRCPLCGAVNAATNGECFVCRWHGEFEREPAIIEQGINELIAHSPELDEALNQCDWVPQPQAARLRAFLRKIFWPVD